MPTHKAIVRQQSRRLSLVVATLALSIAFVLLVVHQYVVGRGHLLSEVRTQAAIIGANSAAALLFNDAAAAGEVLASVRLTSKIDSAALYRTDRTLLAADEREATVFPARRAEDAPLVWEAGLPGLPVRGRLAQPVLLHGSPVGTLVLRFSLADLHRQLFEYAAGVLGIGAIAALLAHQLTRRLRRRAEEAEERLLQQAFVDSVTGLPNRRYFEQELRRITQSLRHYPRGVALFFVDLDDFKKVNDSLGHEVGDRVLGRVAERLRSSVRASDVVARVGGDEFAALLLDAGGPDSATRVAREMLATLAEVIVVDDVPVHIGISIGIALIPEDGDDATILLRRADQAMYVVKESGKNGFHFFSHEIDERVQYDLRLENTLREALDQDTGLWVAYQPQFCARSRRCVGLEALVRWQGADGAAISPAEFVPILERSGLINRLGEWVLRRVCQDLARWREAGARPPRIALNLSPRQLLRGMGVFDAYSRIIRQHGETVAAFELELTEGALLEARGRDVLDAFRAAGFELAIDDFGTGYSSLGYLRSFRVNRLKIDRSFIRQVPGTAEDEAIVNAIIQVARALRIEVVAEGVETAEQAEFLAACGCDVLQGFLLGRPQPPEALLSLFERVAEAPPPG